MNPDSFFLSLRPRGQPRKATGITGEEGSES